MMSNSESRKTLQMITNVLKKQLGSDTGQPLDWADLKQMIVEAVRNNDPREKFDELHANVVVLMEDLVSNGQLNAYSADIQNAAVAYEANKHRLTKPGSKQALQQICNTLKQQSSGTGQRVIGTNQQ